MSMDVEKKRQDEIKTVAEIIKIYCHGHRHLRATGKELCPECQKMSEYALVRLAKCPRMDIKTFCSVCPVHCYGREEAVKIREIMAFGGPRMLWKHPWMTLRHIWIEWRTRHGLRKKEAVIQHK